MSAVRAVFAILTAGLWLASCANPQATMKAIAYGDPAKPYFGMTKDEVIACAGKPSGRYDTNAGETLIYHYSGPGPVPSAGKDKSDERKNMLGRSKSDKSWKCSASLSFEGGRLVRVNFAPREVASPYATKKDAKTGEKVPVPQPEPCTFSLPNCARS
ncbi:MAG: hypothetical protein WBF11_00180 [Methyloceanibacter sp.]